MNMIWLPGHDVKKRTTSLNDTFYNVQSLLYAVASTIGYLEKLQPEGP